MIASTTKPERKYRVLGVNDDSDTCECCGKTGLKRVVWIESLETGLVQHFGVVCAANPAKAFGLKREIDKAVRADDKARQEAERKARYDEQMRDCAVKSAQIAELYAARGGQMRQHICGNGLVLTIPADSKLMDQCHAEVWKK